MPPTSLLVSLLLCLTLARHFFSCSIVTWYVLPSRVFHSQITSCSGALSEESVLLHLTSSIQHIPSFVSRENLKAGNILLNKWWCDQAVCSIWFSVSQICKKKLQTLSIIQTTCTGRLKKWNCFVWITHIFKISQLEWSLSYFRSILFQTHLTTLYQFCKIKCYQHLEFTKL